MKPKTRSELRSKVIDPLYRFLKEHDDLLEFESLQINEALKMLVIADVHLFHLDALPNPPKGSSDDVVGEYSD